MKAYGLLGWYPNGSVDLRIELLRLWNFRKFGGDRVSVPDIFFDSYVWPNGGR